MPLKMIPKKVVKETSLHLTIRRLFRVRLFRSKVHLKENCNRERK